MSRANARIYVEAAKRIDEGTEFYSCNALKRLNRQLEENYRQLFDLGNGFCYSSDNVTDLWFNTRAEANNRRVLMLCLAAAIEFDGRL